MKKYTVDRLEGKLAILLSAGDESIQREIATKQLPADLKEGDVIEIECNGEGIVQEAVINDQETKRRKQKAQSTLQKLRNKQAGTETKKQHDSIDG
ncbi:DUF3006 domain-containing protein [Salibacterium qingdaonense]|uniref:DUF3006 domain-containing protein n=1 Tax=Salibacterium qingdaonense TaxID=266892 RepID=A0A1I4QH23_9BACI|nr:DUF3006 domain-containing protein [Salibacterium qingdaonense]SFM38913.1 Protein of unknown function [Salibacterium qingdaonense]